MRLWFYVKVDSRFRFGAGFMFFVWERFGLGLDFVLCGIIGLLYGSASLEWKGRALLYRKPVFSPRAL